VRIDIPVDREALSWFEAQGESEPEQMSAAFRIGRDSEGTGK
jgi:hypothetical protein